MSPETSVRRMRCLRGEKSRTRKARLRSIERRFIRRYREDSGVGMALDSVRMALDSDR